uniref:USP domain-containing protein n=1 Tax=Strongyloides papillosus TaxID=174720 RepID=A0A0N5BN87_STREA
MTTDSSNYLNAEAMDIDSTACNEAMDFEPVQNVPTSELVKYKAISRKWWNNYLFIRQSGSQNHDAVALWNINIGKEGFDYVILPTYIVDELIKLYGKQDGCDFDEHCITEQSQKNFKTSLFPTKKKIRDNNSLHKQLYRHPAALVNFGNACYVNCALQLLYSIPQLKPSLEKELGYTDFESMRNDKELDDKLLSKTIYDYSLLFEEGIIKDTPVKTKELKQVIDKATEMYICGGQHDLEEFLNWIIDKMDEECSHDNGKELKKLFDSQSTMRLRCPNCQNIKDVIQPFKVLRLSLDSSKEYDSLTNLLENFSKTIILDETDKWKCDKCEEKVCAEMTTTFRHLSDVLIISIKRYIQTLSERNKLFTKIKYPIDELVIDEIDEFGNVTPVKYQLQALAKHKGNSITSGHYTALVKYDNAFWYCNDEDIYLDQMTNNVSKNAYIFVYVKASENVKN